MSRTTIMFSLLIIVIFSLVLSTSALLPNDTDISAGTTDVIPEFIPTNEWQTILPGQSIPPGLWVRMNIATGERTARLLDDNAETEKQAASGIGGGLVLVDTSGGITEAEAPVAADTVSSSDASIEPTMTVLDAADVAGAAKPTVERLLQELPELPASGSASTLTPSQLRTLQATRAAKLRELAKHVVGVTEDFEVIKQMIAVIVDPNFSFDLVIQAIDVLESVVHQVDNAKDFVYLGGLDMIIQIIDTHIRPSDTLAVPPVTATAVNPNDSTAQAAMFTYVQPPQTNDSAENAVSHRLQIHRLIQLQYHAAWLLGTAAQNNAPVQIIARAEAAIYSLITLLNSSLSPSEEERDDADETQIANNVIREDRLRLQAKLLYALSSLIRASPEGQEQFYGYDGLNVIKKILNDETITDDKLSLSVRMKTIGLLQDIITDRLVNHIQSNDTNTQAICDTMHQTLHSPAWCNTYERILSWGLINVQEKAPLCYGLSTLAMQTRHAAIKLISLLTDSSSSCIPTLSTSSIQQLHAALVQEKLAHNITDDDVYYCADMSRLIENNIIPYILTNNINYNNNNEPSVTANK